MDSHHPGEKPGSAALKRSDDRLTEQPAQPVLEPERGPEPIVRFEQVSKWYGNVIAVNKLTLRIPAGVTGLLGPNGAGKSTLLQLATGQLRPSQGKVLVLGQPVWNNPALNHHIGLCPEQDAFWEWMTGRDFLGTCALLTGYGRAEARRRTERALELVRMTEHANRAIGGYSKGMRQRTKLAQALVHDPEVLFLDEPFTGTDPLARHELMEIVLGLGRQGKSVLVSSHVLHEVQSLTQNIVLMNRGRLVAEGNIRDIRDLIDQHPHRIVLVCGGFRRLASVLAAWEDVEGLTIQPAERLVIAETRSPDLFYGRLPELATSDGLVIEEVYSEDDNLEAVFKYLVKS
jgi:ABC-2 type transport system ATP-binding protein